jgi:hypothetical protein
VRRVLAATLLSLAAAADAHAQGSPEELPPAPTLPPPPVEKRIDEVGPLATRAPQSSEADPFCAECIVIGAGVVVALSGIPLIALSEAARRQKDLLDAWVRLQGETEVGFVTGYGFAKADEDQARFLPPGIVLVGVGALTALITGVVLLVRSDTPLFGEGFTIGPRVGSSGGGLEIGGVF